jgi:hypothetical protein
VWAGFEPFLSVNRGIYVFFSMEIVIGLINISRRFVSKLEGSSGSVEDVEKILTWKTTLDFELYLEVD